MRFETLESRRLLTGWLSELPNAFRFVSIAQSLSSDQVCVAYANTDGVGTAKITASSTPQVDVTPTEAESGFGSPFAVTDTIFRDDGAFEMVGSALTDRSLPGGNGEPTLWIDSVLSALGLESTIAGNAGVFNAIHRDGRAVGEDDLQPIIHAMGQTSPLPLGEHHAIGAALDLNDNRVVGFADDEAVVWNRSAEVWVLQILEQRDESTFGSANTISDYGIAGGSDQRNENGRTVGVLWNRDGSILREFLSEGDTAVTHVIDSLAAVRTERGSQIYHPTDGSLTDVDDFLREVGQLDIPEGPLNVIDLELSDDREQILVLLESASESEPKQYAASFDADLLAGSWQHPWNRYDVNGDGVVTPRDALIVINRLARDPTTQLPNGGTRQNPYYDVTGDSMISPRDALGVINQLAVLAHRFVA
ncbi:dockerin type I domain-containing protein [Stieleria sp. ICT_E10.1]|uniref:dockerin type I domain-containing protein n=1 Tax=Stieleria sedimenti TaxID=2976331 RepID=UPI00217FBACD|nr:dockerin type I domain-containing protein [Stieleria sedimenti]MCS7469112.1 dockerin type I domain-containing protein [Stieleria sedimenti]